MTVRELADRVAELERELAEVKARPPVEHHFHTHQHYPLAQQPFINPIYPQPRYVPGWAPGANSGNPPFRMTYNNAAAI